MLERRNKTRRRVCWQGSVTSGLSDPVLKVHIRNVSETGAQVRLDGGAVMAREVDFRVDRTGRVRRAEVVWRAMELYGLRFRKDHEEPAEPRSHWMGPAPLI